MRAAARVFRARGFAAAGMRDIAVAADLSPGNLYHYFRGKEELLFFCQDQSLNRLLDVTLPAMPLVLKPGRTLLVPGHGRISDYGELVEYRDMVTVIRDIIQDMIGSGMTLEQVKAANPTQGYRRRYGADSGPWTTNMFVEAIYSGLKKPAGKS